MDATLRNNKSGPHVTRYLLLRVDVEKQTPDVVCRYTCHLAMIIENDTSGLHVSLHVSSAFDVWNSQFWISYVTMAVISV